MQIAPFQVSANERPRDNVKSEVQEILIVLYFLKRHKKNLIFTDSTSTTVG